MRETLILAKVYLLEILGINRFLHSHDPKKKRRTIGIGCAIGFSMLMLVVYSFLYNYFMGKTFAQLAQLDLLPAFMVTICGALCLFTTLYKGSGVLFGSTDHALALPLPVHGSSIVSAKLIYLYVLNVGFTLLVMLPCIVAYGILAQPAFWFYPLALLLTLLIPVLPLLLGCLIGMVIAFAAGKFRHKNAVALVLSLLLLIGFMAGSMVLPSMDEAQLISGATSLMESVYSTYPPAWLYVKAVCEGDPLAILGSIVGNFGLAALFIWLVGRNYAQINMHFRAHAPARTKHEKEAKTYQASTPFAALIRKEIRRYFTGTVYFMNGGIGAVLLLIASVALLVTREQLLAIEGAALLFDLYGKLLPALIGVMLSMCTLSASSISLEGNTFGLLRTLPLPPMMLFQAKAAAEILIVLPAAFIAAIVLSIVLQVSWIAVILTVLVAALSTVMISLMGVAINLRWPMLNWTNEVTVIKQSAATLFVMLFGLLFLIPMAAMLFLLPMGWGAALALLYNAGCIVLVYRWLQKQGVERFNALEA